jgi:hypothetical protein
MNADAYTLFLNRGSESDNMFDTYNCKNVIGSYFDEEKEKFDVTILDFNNC